MKDIESIIGILNKRYPETIFDKRCRNPFEVLIYTILSQRSKDSMTDIAFADLMEKYKTPQSIADADPKDIEPLIVPSGCYRSKAKWIVDISKTLCERYDCKVPEDKDILMSLKGIGPKTAACVMVYGFNMPDIPVDTHCHRIPNRMGLIITNTPKESETELKRIISKKDWIKVNECFVRLGQDICHPKRPDCKECPVAKHCDFAKAQIG